jgi:hypothetical protein
MSLHFIAVFIDFLMHFAQIPKQQIKSKIYSFLQFQSNVSRMLRARNVRRTRHGLTAWEDESSVLNFGWENLRESDHLGDRGVHVDGRIIFRWNLKGIGSEGEDLIHLLRMGFSGVLL